MSRIPWLYHSDNVSPQHCNFFKKWPCFCIDKHSPIGRPGACVRERVCVYVKWAWRVVQRLVDLYTLLANCLDDGGTGEVGTAAPSTTSCLWPERKKWLTHKRTHGAHPVSVPSKTRWWLRVWHVVLGHVTLTLKEQQQRKSVSDSIAETPLELKG